MDYIYFAVLILLQVCLLVQLYYVVVYHQKLAAYQINDNRSGMAQPVSVIVCAKNELENLRHNLPLLLKQDHPDFEIIVVNDCSIDGSGWFLKDFSEQNPRVRVVTIDEHPRFKHGKKFAVTLGIKASKNENMVFTDADCRPASNNWLRLMQRNFAHDKEIVLGYSPYEKAGGLLNKVIRFETLMTAINYLSFALSGRPYMGVGRNLAYKKSLFFRGKGFASHMHIMSGDDDLFVNQNANSGNTLIEIHPDAHVLSEPKDSLSAYFKQKLRHQGAGRAYRKDHKQVLTAQAVSGILFYLTLGLMIALQGQWYILVSVYLIRTLVQVYIYFPIYRKLNSADLIWWMPILDIIYYFYLFAVSLLGIFKKKIAWK